MMFSPDLPLNYMLGRNESGMTLSNHQHAQESSFIPGKEASDASPNSTAVHSSIRLYRNKDRAEVEKVIREAEDELPFSRSHKLNIGQNVRHWLEDGYAQASFYLLFVCNELAGLVGFTPAETGFGEVCQLQPLYLRTNARGCGYGQQLLDHTINGARESGYRRCYLEISEHLGEAIRLIESYGFYKMPASPRRIPGEDNATRHYMKYIF